jgi:hypothetical protein
MLSLNKPEFNYIIFGCIACIINGAMQPAFSIIFSKVISVFAECDPEKQKNGILMYCFIFIGMGIVSFFSYFFQVNAAFVFSFFLLV